MAIISTLSRVFALRITFNSRNYFQWSDVSISRLMHSFLFPVFVMFYAMLFFDLTENGKVVIVTAGRFAGKKAIVVKTFDEGNSDKKFSHCLIAGLAANPRKVTRAMSKEKVEKRSKALKPFIKYINMRHVFPTRYLVDIDLKKVIDETDLVDPDKKKNVKKELKKIFYDRYVNQKEFSDKEKKVQGSSYFFQKLRF
jgi:large subunit ribosomal protein L27e